MKAFIAALAVGALALLGGASAASSAQPSLQHYMIGFGHSPNAADAALVKSHGGTVRQSFQSIGVLAVDMPSDQVNDVKRAAGVSYVEADPVRTPLTPQQRPADVRVPGDSHERPVRPRDDTRRRGAGSGLQGHRGQGVRG